LLSQQPEITRLDPNEVSAFITQKAIENDLIKEILSDPSGFIPASAISQPKLFINDDNNNKDDTELSDDDFNVTDDDDNGDKLRQLIEEWLSEQYSEKLTVISCESDEEITGVTFGMFVEHRRNLLFDYQVTESGISYQPIQLVRDLPKEKLEILSELNSYEIVALIRLVQISKAIGGTVTILNDADFEDEYAALDIYGFSDLDANPVLYYRHEQLGVSIATQLFWGDEDIESMSFSFVKDSQIEKFSIFDSFDEAFDFAIMRLNYYIQES